MILAVIQVSGMSTFEDNNIMRLLLNLIIIITLGIAFTLFRAEHQVNQTIEIATEECNLNCWPYHGKSAFFVIPESM